MKLQTVTNFYSSTKLLVLFSVLVVLLSLAFSSFIYFYSQQEINNAKNEIYILDDRGNIYYGQLKNMNIDYRIFEYEDHIRDFYNLFYSFDETNYKSNIERALWLAGECGKELKKLNDEQEVYKNLVEKNLSVTVQILELKINKNSRPYKGFIKGIQTIKRKGGSLSRHLDCSFIITDANGRSRSNPHGAKIIDWEITNYEPIKEKK